MGDAGAKRCRPPPLLLRPSSLPTRNQPRRRPYCTLVDAAESILHYRRYRNAPWRSAERHRGESSGGDGHQGIVGGRGFTALRRFGHRPRGGFQLLARYGGPCKGGRCLAHFDCAGVSFTSLVDMEGVGAVMSASIKREGKSFSYPPTYLSPTCTTTPWSINAIATSVPNESRLMVQRRGEFGWHLSRVLLS